MTIPRSRLRTVIPMFFQTSPKDPRYRELPKVFPLQEKTAPKLRTYIGKVIRTEYPRTCVVQVENTEINSEVLKVYQHQHWVHVHDPEEECYIGDEIIIVPRDTQPGVAYHGKPYKVLKFISKAPGYTDHYEGKVWSREEKPSSYRREDTRLRARYTEEYLFKNNLIAIKGKRDTLEETAYGKHV